MKKNVAFGIGWFLVVTIATGAIVTVKEYDSFPLTGALIGLIKKGYWAYCLVGVASLLVGKTKNFAAAAGCAATAFLTYTTLLIYESIVYGSDHNLLGIELAMVFAMTLPWLLPGLVADRLMNKGS